MVATPRTVERTGARNMILSPFCLGFIGPLRLHGHHSDLGRAASVGRHFFVRRQFPTSDVALGSQAPRRFSGLEGFRMRRLLTIEFDELHQGRCGTWTSLSV